MENLNHAVVLIGYGIDPENNMPYWKVQNSWGTKWGENGFFRIMRDGKCRCGICFIPSQIKISHEGANLHESDFNHPDAFDYNFSVIV